MSAAVGATADRPSAGTATDRPVVETAFAVEGMFCGGCAATVERALTRLPGVAEVSVSFLSDSAFVRHDPDAVGPGDLARGLSALGYATRPLGTRDARAAQDAFLRGHRVRLGVALGLGMWVMLATIARYFTDLPDPAYAWWLALASGVFSLPVLAYSGAPFFRLGWRGLRAGVPGMESLILVATVAAVGVSGWTLARGGHHVWFEVPVMLIAFQLVARLGDVGARRRAADAVRSMLDLSPERARRVRDDGLESVGVAELVVGDRIESRAGERLPADGTVVDGTALIDTALLSGESAPVAVGPGDAVLAGTVNVDGRLRVRVTEARGTRTLDRLAAAVGRALNAKSDLMRLVDRIAGALVPGIGIAALVAFALALGTGSTLEESIVRALATLVVSCPCALSLAVPFVVASSASTAAREGIVLRDASILEHAHRIDVVLLDKTGTLTEGRLAVARVVPAPGRSAEEVLRAAALAEGGSNHPLARAILRHARERGIGPDGARGADDTGAAVLERRESAGAGTRATLANGATLLAGSPRWLAEHGVHGVPDPVDPACSRVLVAADGEALGAVELADTVRADAGPLLDALRARGLRPVLASGDAAGPVEAVADRFDLERHARMTPDDKRALVEALRADGHRVAFVGDGLNDAPALAAADLGIATGEASDLARSAAALSVLRGGLDAVDFALRLARRAARTLRRNLALALGYNALLLPAALLGFVHPVLAVLAMALSVVSVALSSLPLTFARRRPAGRAEAASRVREVSARPDHGPNLA